MDSPEFAGLKEYVIRTQRDIYFTMIQSKESLGEDLLDGEDEGYVEEEEEEEEEVIIWRINR